MAHSPHAHILEHARLSLALGHVARRANVYLIALVSRSAAMMTWENHASAIPTSTPRSPQQARLGSLRRVTCRGMIAMPRHRVPGLRVRAVFPPIPVAPPHCTRYRPTALWRVPGIGRIMNHRTIKV